MKPPIADASRLTLSKAAAFLWVAEGTAITAFASEDKKGMYVSIFWSIFQFGVVIGAAIPGALTFTFGGCSY